MNEVNEGELGVVARIYSGIVIAGSHHDNIYAIVHGVIAKIYYFSLLSLCLQGHFQLSKRGSKGQIRVVASFSHLFLITV